MTRTNRPLQRRTRMPRPGSVPTRGGVLGREGGGAAGPLGRAALVAALLAGLAGCSSYAGDACVDPDTTANSTVLNKRDVTPRNCDGNFLSARNQREVLYGGDDNPRLYTGEGARVGGGIDASHLDVASPSGKASRPVTAYLGTLKIGYDDTNAKAEDIAAAQRAPASRAKPNQPVSVDFEKASLDYILKQLLGGALGLNYIAPDDLGGSVTFRTEQPIPRDRILQIVRDLLARSGYELRDINGVYHVGKPDLIASIEGVSEAGRSADRLTRIVHLKNGNAADVVNLAKQMLPASVNLITTNSPTTLLVRAAPADLDQVESVINQLTAGQKGEDRVAIIPIHQSAPDQIASQLGEIYHSRGADVSIVPLVQQQGILVTTRDSSVMKGVRALVRAMDTEVRDEAALRIIPLQHLNATDTADRLGAIFGNGGGGNGRSGNGNGRAGGLGSGAGTLGSGTGTLGSGTGTLGSGGLGGGNYPTPSASDLAPSGPTTGYPAAANGGANGSGLGSGTGDAGGSGNVVPAAVRSAAGGRGGGNGGNGEDQTKIVADKSSNSVMVFSTYTTFKRIKDVLQTLDIPQAQAVIEATIVEVTLNDQLQQGVQFFLTGRGFSLGSGDVSNLTGGATTGSTGTTGTTGTATGSVSGTTVSGTGSVGSSLGSSLGSALANNNGGALSIGANLTRNLRVDAVLSALQGVTKVKVISSPYLTVTNGKEARLVVGDQIPYSTRTQSSNNLGNNTTTNEVTIKDTGIILDITPDIHANNEVGLKISQSVSTPSQTNPLGGTLTPVISTRSVDSEVLLQSGRTVLLGGLIQDRLEQQEGGIPVLRTVPGVGDLFKSKTDSVQRVELILMLTPRVTRSASEIENLAQLLKAQIHTR